MNKSQQRKSSSGQVLTQSEVNKLLAAVPDEPTRNLETHLIKSGFAKLLQNYKERARQTDGQIGHSLGLRAAVVKRMRTTVTEFSIDFYIEHLSELEDKKIRSYLDKLVDLSFLGERNPFKFPGPGG